MRFNKKKAMALSLVLCMLAMLSFSTLAWFNATDSVTNKFFVATAAGGDASKPNDIFSIDIWEHVDKDNDGVIEDDNNGVFGVDDEKDQDGLEIQNIVPGGYYEKKPYVENTGGYDQWVRVMVTVTDAAAWTDILGANYDLSTIFIGYEDSVWTRDTIISGTSADTLTYVYYLNHKLAPAGMARLFSGVKFPEHLTQAEFAKINGSFELTITADAMQADAISATTAKEAFEHIGWAAGTPYAYVATP